MDLDDILNDALDEVTQDEEVAPASDASENVQSALSSAAATTAKTQDENAQKSAAESALGEDNEFSNLLKMFGSGSDFEKILDDAFKDLDLNDLLSKLGAPPAEGGAEGEDAELERLMKLLGSSSLGGGAEGGSAPSEPFLDPKVLENLAEKLEENMGGDQMNKMIEQMMKSVMSKEVMYEPIKKVTEEYPKVLEKKGLSAEDKSRFESQFSAYRALRACFEVEGETDHDKILQIMQDLERFGQPPEEVAKVLGEGGPPAPGPGGMPPGFNPAMFGPEGPPNCPTQ